MTYDRFILMQTEKGQFMLVLGGFSQEYVDGRLVEISICSVAIIVVIYSKLLC